ncbi:MAG: hypothetical protein ABIM50_08170 [Novosphingobium sp.]
MELYEAELADAKARLAAAGRAPEQFNFAMEYLPPDPDGGGMFTVQYLIEIAETATGKTKGLIGGIGMHWVDRFEELVKEGYFD